METEENIAGLLGVCNNSKETATLGCYLPDTRLLLIAFVEKAVMTYERRHHAIVRHLNMVVSERYVKVALSLDLETTHYQWRLHTLQTL